MNMVLWHTDNCTQHVTAVVIYNHRFKNETVFLHILVSPVHPQGNSLYISECVQASTLPVTFLLYYDKMFTKMTISYILEL
jgi:hypothetical protein